MTERRSEMVVAEKAPMSIHSAAASGHAVVAAKRRGQQLAIAIVAAAFVVTLAAGQLREKVDQPMLLETSKRDEPSVRASDWGKVTTSKQASLPDDHNSYDGISDGLVGSLEQAMDVSIDNKVSAFLSAPAIGSLPIPGIGPVVASGGRGAFVPSDYKAEYADKMATHSYLAKLNAEKRQLERQKAKLMADLRAQHTAVATQVARASVDLNEQQLARALEIAKFRQAQQAQQAARAMAKKMREATIAKQTYIHAQAVAEQRIHDLDEMVHLTNPYGSFIAKPQGSSAQQLSATPAENDAHAVVDAADAKPVDFAVAKPAPAGHAAAATSAASAGDVSKGAEKRSFGASVERGEAKKGTKLYHYLQEQKELEAKIKAAERAAMRHDAGKGTSGSSHNSKVQTAFIHTIAKALYDNKTAIKKDETVAQELKDKQKALFASMRALKQSDELLFQKVNAVDSSVKV